MMLFATPAYNALAMRLQQQYAMTVTPWTARRFPNDEWHLSLQHPVRGEPCMVLATITPPDEQLVTTMLLCHTLKKEGATRVTALLPYLAYTRQDKNEPGQSWATAWVGQLLTASGIDDVITVDIHSEHAQALMAVSVRSLSPASIWAEEITRLDWRDATLVAPDHGAVARCDAVRQAAGMSAPIVWCEKHRTPVGVRSTLRGQAATRNIIIDDMLDTGGTLLACCEGLLAAGTREIRVMVTHGLFTGTAWQRLWELGVQRIYCTDTVPLPAQAISDRITQCAILPLLNMRLAG